MLASIQTLGSLVVAASLVSCAQVDYVIVGGGTAGLVLANRLTENKSTTVLVLEAGGDGLGNQNISDINLIGSTRGTQVDWQFPTEPLVHGANQTVGNMARGKVLGGSSAINGDVFDRGDAREYDAWETLGNSGWNFKSLFAASKKSEKFFAPDASQNIQFVSSEHGLTGNIATSYATAAPSIHDIIMASVVNAGGVKSADVAGGNVDGITHVTNARLPSNNTRSTSATGYYFPFSSRSNFKVTLFATVTRIVWKSTGDSGAVAAGVEYIDQNGVTHIVNTTNVILSAGTIGSPNILERSGVGNATFLGSLGIASVIDLPGVGENLQEQPLAPLQFTLNSSLPLTPVQPFLLNFESLQKTVGPDNLSTAQSLLSVKPPSISNALYSATKELANEELPWIEGYIVVAAPPSGPAVLSWFASELHPMSRGSVHIASKVATENPNIQLNFFESPFDLFVAAAASQRIQKIASTPPLSDWITGPIVPSADVTSIDDLQDFIRANVGMAEHALGTAVMAPRQDGGVVDTNLKVYGTTNVYVIDASIIPLQPSGHLQGTVYAVAEVAAQRLKQHA